MVRWQLILVCIPLIIRHSHHYICTRHAPRPGIGPGFLSVAIWFLSYITLMAGMGYYLFSGPFRLLFWPGYLLLWLATLGRMISIHQLGRVYSECIHIAEGQQLIDTGIYAYLRHPLHYFLLLEMISMALLTRALWGWGVVAVSFITLIVRERQEEKALEEKFGDAYRTYRKHAVALVDLFPAKK